MLCTRVDKLQAQGVWWPLPLGLYTPASVRRALRLVPSYALRGVHYVVRPIYTIIILSYTLRVICLTANKRYMFRWQYYHTQQIDCKHDCEYG
jgi:hypothetical protein